MSVTEKKPHMNIGTIGHVDHGKTTLTAAITKVMSALFGGASFSYEQIDKSPEEQKRKITIKQTVVPYNTRKRSCSHTDCPGHADYIKNFITGASQMDVAILVVSAADGPQQQTREHILLAKQIGVKRIVVFLNKCDMADPDFIDLALDEVKDELKKHGFIRDEDGFREEDLIVAKGSALKALNGDKEQEQVIVDFFDQIDTKIPDPIREMDKPFLMSIDQAFSITGRGTVVTGLVETGRLSLANKATPAVQLVRRNEVISTVATGIEAFKKSLEQAQAGENVGVLLRGVSMEQVERGDILCEPNTIKTHKAFSAEFFVLSEKDGGRHTPFFVNYRPQFFIRTLDITGQIVKIHGGKEMILPGENARVDVLLIGNAPLEKGLKFAVREGGKTIGAGVIIDFLDHTQIKVEKRAPGKVTEG